MIVVYGGVQADEPGSQPGRFPADAVPELAARLRILFANAKPRIAVGAAANGVDLLAIEGALAEHVAVRVVLPFSIGEFRRTSVESRGADWTAKYDRLIRDHGSSIETGSENPDQGDVYTAHNSTLLDRAEALLNPGERLWVVVVRPEAPTGSVSDDLADRAEARGHLVLNLRPGTTPRPVVFVAMPYGDKFDPTSRRLVNCDDAFHLVYVPALLASNASIKRADLETDSGIIHVGMIEDLAKSDLVLCDLSTANSNVAYEMGLRHAFADRSTLLVFPSFTESKRPQIPPFDVLPIRQARFTRSTRITESEAEQAIRVLLPFLQTALEGSASDADSPVHAWFERSDNGVLRRREELAGEALVEQELRAHVQQALLSSDANLMQTSLSRVRAAALPDRVTDGLRIQLAAGLISEGLYHEANEVLAIGRPAGEPLWVLWAQQKAHATRRLGEVEAREGRDPQSLYAEAEDLLRSVIKAVGDSSESCGLAAGLAKRRAMALLRNGERLRATGHIAHMVELYQRGWEAEPNAYMGVNLITGLRLQAHHFGGAEGQDRTARDLAPVVLFFAERERNQAPDDFYPMSSVAEVRLCQALLAPDEEREDSLSVAAGAFARAAALPAAPDNIQASGDQFEFLALCGDDQNILDTMASFFRKA